MGLRLFPVAVVLVLAGPVAAGLLGALLPAFGWLPALGGDALSLRPWQDLMATPGLGTAVLLALGTGLGSTVLALGAVLLFVAGFSGTRLFRRMGLAISPLLSLPHAAAAIGLAFLLSPSGWLFRLISPWATGFDRPPDLLIVHDPLGLMLMLGLAAKEVPFLWLMTLAALPQADPARAGRLAASLGYGRVTGFLLAVLPRLYPQIRLPVYAVVAFATSNVDVALVLGPTTPPPLGVMVLRLAADPDLAARFSASAAAVLQLGVTGLALGLWIGAERVAAALGRRLAGTGRRDHGDRLLAGLGAVMLLSAVAAVGLGLAGLALWSVAGPWRFPAVWPDRIDLGRWASALPMLVPPLVETAVIAVLSVAMALVLVVGTLRAGGAAGKVPALVYLPLLVPQVSFLFGLQILLLASGAGAGLGVVVAAHLVFVLPYVALSLADPWRALDPRFERVAAALGASPARIFWRIRLPMLARPLATAAAVGFAVSVGLYLPTVLIGAAGWRR
ncbi:Inner membrane ABC transporter permease protein YnjC [Methylobrevis pamukkalensis]|uniref:Inner membrane ABC transporter permease protein YnjC n=1 Tax=Methylobrevis pamukkalensis TaxID=1439726 RepID=A0A1E3GX65_9HYPH|nr:Inner membrane ABC transporter permease protein YnjC [Methylobrevis pamukkalensis]